MNFTESQTLTGRRSSDSYGGSGFVSCVAVINKNMFVSGYDNLKIWDITSGQVIKTLTGYFNVNCVAVINENTIVSGTLGSWVIWDINSGKEIQLVKKDHDVLMGINCIAVIDEKTIVSGSKDHSLTIWDIISGKEIKN